LDRYGSQETSNLRELNVTKFNEIVAAKLEGLRLKTFHQYAANIFGRSSMLNRRRIGF
jgi:hypothetical protein